MIGAFRFRSSDASVIIDLQSVERIRVRQAQELADVLDVDTMCCDEWPDAIMLAPHIIV